MTSHPGNTHGRRTLIYTVRLGNANIDIFRRG